jgi:hypothetical protein
MPRHSAHEQYLLELINAERAKAGVQPLAFDNDLSEAAEGHSRWMLAQDVFSHTGSGGSSPTTRMKNAGYTLSGSWATGENIAWATTRSPTGYNDEVKLLHTNLMNSPGHRANLLNGNFREVGLGFEVGDYKGRQSAFVTENFGKTGSDIFLTGVAFDDKDGDRFYDPGEGMGGLTVTAKNSAGTTFKTTTSLAGGYDLALKAGTYTVTFSGPGIQSSTQTVTIGTKNVKRDLIDPKLASGTQAVQETAPASQDDPEPTQPTQPTPTQPAPSGNDGPSSNWLADFFAKYRSTGTLAEHEEAESAPSVAKTTASVAFDGDHIVFRPKRDVAEFDRVDDDIRDWATGLAERLASRWESEDRPDHGAAAVDADTDAAQAVAAKILAQFSASQAGTDLAA